MKNEKEIRKYLSVIKRATSLIEGLLEEDGGMMEKLMEEPEKKEPVRFETKPVQAPQRPVELPNEREAFVKSLVNMKDWPEAIPQFLAIEKYTPADEATRAKSILDKIMDKPLNGLRVLDFGCGDGWITQEIGNRGATPVVGYDIVRSEKWKSHNNALFVDTFSRISDHSFDVVLLYDVLDHCVRPEEVMKQVRSVLSPNGLVYVRCHPWTSKHATHIYRIGLNKSYAHLLLRPEEIRPLLSVDPIFTRADINPRVSYHHWFKDFHILKEQETRENVPEFFSQPAVKKALLFSQGVTDGYADRFWELLQVQFVYFVLKL